MTKQFPSFSAILWYFIVDQVKICKYDLNITHLDGVVMKVCHDNFIFVVDSNKMRTCM